MEFELEEDISDYDDDNWLNSDSDSLLLVCPYFESEVFPEFLF